MKLISKDNLRYFFKYLLIGIVNTIVGYGVIFSLMYVGVIPEISNLIGYAVGITVSHFLNKKYNFKSSISNKKTFPRFVFAMLIAYVGNLLTLVIGYRLFKFNPYFVQVIAGGVYTIFGFILSRYWVFK